MKMSYKEMFPSPTGMFTKKQLVEMPYGDYENTLRAELKKRFMTVEEAAKKMDCSIATARKRLKGIKCMVMDEKNRFGRCYYTSESAKEVIKYWLEKGKEGNEKV